MKTIIITAVIIFVLIIGGVVSMFMFDLCPPQGPWPMPPWCEKIVRAGKDTTVTFWLTLPYDLEVEKVELQLERQKPREMKRVGELSYELEIDTKTREKINYTYLLDDQITDDYQIEIERMDQKVNDYVNNVGDYIFEPNLPEDQIYSAFMMDTWGANYNFNMFENTRKHINSAFTRVAETGATEVIVTDMAQTYFNNKDNDYVHNSTDYEIRGAIFGDDMRDEAMTDDDIEKLGKAAKEKGLVLAAEVGVSFRNIGKYFKTLDVKGGEAEFWNEFGKAKTEEWINDFFDKWQAYLIARAGKMVKAGFDTVYVTPRAYVNFYPYESLANTRWKTLISEVQKTGIRVGAFLNTNWLYNDWQEDWSKYDYYTLADKILYHIDSIDERYNPTSGMSILQMKNKFELYLKDVKTKAKNSGIEVGVIFAAPSYKDAILEGYLEFNDILDEYMMNKEIDWQHQADAYEAFFQAAEGEDWIKEIDTFGYWWDDAMDPKTANNRISITQTTRNKPAEAVFKKWVK